jgi:hypothetical protein
MIKNIDTIRIDMRTRGIVYIRFKHSIITDAMQQFKIISFVIILPLMLFLQCGFSRGHYTTRDGTRVSGYIRSAGYTHPVRDPLPGHVSEYTLVESEEIITFFKAYNTCSQAR